jgi:hypothetical protein
VLRYSRRAALLRHAQRAGIPRFEANLIIATVLRRCVRLDPGSNTRDGESGWGAAVLLVLAIQAAIAAAAWWVISA